MLRLARHVAAAAAIVLLGAGASPAQDRPLNIIVFGAHPDDCDIRAGGAGIKWAKAGHRVRFVSLTNGDAGHQSQGGGALGARRRAEAQEAGKRFGVDYVVLDNHDGELLPDLNVRGQVIRQIRQWKADLVLAPRPNDYHPDHRYTGVLVQDAAYMVTVPNVASDTPALTDNPVFMYVQDGFQKPAPFRPDVAVSIDEVIDQKVYALDAHVSQFYEWLAWHEHILDTVPKDAKERLVWLKKLWGREEKVTDDIRAALVKRYGEAKGQAITYAEAFEVCEYGKQPDETLLKKLFPF
jgi:LmbE family N-acetylglucosaminyl deacetylase